MMFNESRTSIRKVWHALSAVPLLATATFAAGETPVSDRAEVVSALRGLTEDVIARWTILELQPGGTMRLGSPVRPDPMNPGFCSRDVLQLGVDDAGKVLSTDSQTALMNTSGIVPSFRMFALSENGSCSIASEHFFRARTMAGTTAPPFALVIARNLASNTWSTGPKKYRIQYLDGLAKRCLGSQKPIQILDVREVVAPKGALAYQIVFGGCPDKVSDMVITADTVVSLDHSRVDVGVAALAKAEYECAQLECRRDMK